MDVVIGIDLGTSNSCAACYQNGKVTVLKNCEGDRITPSVVFFESKKNIYVGKYAKSRGWISPEWAVFEIKRLIGRNKNDPYLKKTLKYHPFTLDPNSEEPVVLIKRPEEVIKMKPSELCAVILKKIKKDVEDKLGYTVDKAVITVPAYFNIYQRKVTLSAAEEAGIKVLKLLNEPTAAALCYFKQNSSYKEEYVLVYDLGGGTFDVSILKKTNINIDVICVDGDSNLGGHNFDELIIDYVLGELKNKYNFVPNRRQLRRLQNQCEEAKKELSIATEAAINIYTTFQSPDIVEIVITREHFEKLIDLAVRQTILIVDNCLKSSGLNKDQINTVILSGGSTRIPKCQNALRSYFNEKPLNKFINPDECVGAGAALQAALLSTDPSQKIDILKIKEVIPLSLGTADFCNRMCFVIKRNTPIPVSKSVTHLNIYNQQTFMTFHIYEGERLNASKNNYLAILTIENLTPAPPNECEVTVTFTIDNNGILTVTAREKLKNNAKNLEVTYVRGITCDMDAMATVQSAEANLEEDIKFKKFANQKEHLLEYCTHFNYNLKTKNLTEKYQDCFDLCVKLQEEAGSLLDMIFKDRIKEMINEVKEKCEPVVKKHKFKNMPPKLRPRRKKQF